jgi:hypothetical protein
MPRTKRNKSKNKSKIKSRNKSKSKSRNKSKSKLNDKSESNTKDVSKEQIISNTDFVFYTRDNLYDALLFFLQRLPSVLIEIICNYTYLYEYSPFHYHMSEYDNHEGIYSSICHGDYIVEIVDDMCYVKNFITKRLIKKQIITHISVLISNEKKRTAINIEEKICRPPGPVRIRNYSFNKKNEEVYYSYLNEKPIFYVDFTDDKCTITELEIYDVYDVYDGFGNLTADLITEISTLLSKKIQEMKFDQEYVLFALNEYDIKGLPAFSFFNPESNYYIDENYCLNIVFIRNVHDKYLDKYIHYYVLNYDLKAKEIIHYYELDYDLCHDSFHTSATFNKMNINISKITSSVALNHYLEHSEQYCELKRRVI